MAVFNWHVSVFMSAVEETDSDYTQAVIEFEKAQQAFFKTLDDGKVYYEVLNDESK